MKTRNLLISLGVLFLVSPLVNSSYAIDRDTIIGLWYLDDSDNVAKDSSGNNHDGNLFGDTEWEKGRFGEALQLVKNGGVQIPFEGVPDEYTLSVWIYQISNSDIPEGQTILSSSSAGERYGFWLLSTGEQVRLYSFETDSAPATGSMCTEPKTMSLEEWHHIAVTAVKGGDSVIYIDGLEKARQVNDGEGIGSAAYCIGALRVEKPLGFDGIIDEVVIFNVVLPAADIAKIASRGIDGAMAVSSSGKLPTTWSRIKKSIQN